MDNAIVFEILDLVEKVGVPAVKAIITAWNKPVTTLADVKALHGLVQSAESYFVVTSAAGASSTTKGA